MSEGTNSHNWQRRKSQSYHRIWKYFPYQNALKVGKAPYFLGISKIREIIYISEGVCSVKSYRLWRNALYKAGYAVALTGCGPTRVATLEESDSAGRFFLE